MRRGDVAREIVAALRTLSLHRLGAIILVEPIGTVEDGVLVDGLVSRDLLVAIFTPEHVKRLHQGAVVLRGDRIERVAAPIS